MTLSIAHNHDVIGHDITVTVTAEAGELIQSVETDLDGFPLANESLNAPQTSYMRTFARVGAITPNLNHMVTLTAVNTNGQSATSSTEWTD
jgi:hypothetical protein